MAAVLLLGLLGPAGARAEGSHVYDYWGNASDGEFTQTDGDKFHLLGPRGLAVNDSTGDLYSADTGNNRIQQFDQAGDLIRVWGFDVVKSGKPNDAGTAIFEICDTTTSPPNLPADCKAGISSGVAPVNGLGGQLSAPEGVSIDQTTGDVYVVDRGFFRIQEFSSSGAFIRAFGKNVVQTAQPGDRPAASAKQTLTITATGGKYTLEFQGQKTADLAFDADAATIQSALGSLSTIGSGNIEVSGAASPFTITFKGALANNPEPDIAAAPAADEPLTGGGASVVTTTPGSNEAEICNQAAACKVGVSGSTGGAIAASGVVPPGMDSAIAPSGAPNAGDLLVADAANRRVDEFTAAGAFVRAFGWDVVAAGPGNDASAPADEFEVCRAAAFDVCKVGSAGSGAGQFGQSGGGSSATPNGVTEDQDGNIYTVEKASNFRVQRFTLLGSALTPQGPFYAAGLSGNAQTRPLEVAVDGDGFLYVAKGQAKGTGNPPVSFPPASEFSAAQPRVLKVDPQAGGATVEELFANPGEFENGMPEGVVGLALRGSGLPVYVATENTALSRSRIYRLDEIAGLSATLEEPSEVGATAATLKATITPAAIPLDTYYRFEYLSAGDYAANGESFEGPNKPTRAPLPDFNLGNGEDGGESSQCSGTGGVEAATCRVALRVSGLQPGTTYKVRLRAATVFNGAVAIDTQDIEIPLQAPPFVTTGGARWSSPAASEPTLVLGGTVNPNRAPTSYHFEYVEESRYLADLGSGDGFQGAARTPTAEAGRGVEDVAVHAVVFGADPGSAYRFRLVAENQEGSESGEAEAVGPPSDGERFYEWVSRGDSWGAGLAAEVGSLADSGERVQFSAQAFGEPRSVPFPVDPYIASRGHGGWTVDGPLPDPDHANRGLSEEVTLASDLGAALWTESSLGERLRSEARLGIARLDGSLAAASGQLAPLARGGSSGMYDVRGAASDLSSAVFGFNGGNSGGVSLLPGEPLLSGKSNLYEVAGAGGPSPELRIVNRADGAAGPILGGACGAGLGGSSGTGEVAISSHAVSADGSVVYFSARPGEAPPPASCSKASPKRLYKRIAGSETVEVSKPTCASPCGEPNGSDEFKGASADGSVVFFTSPRRLSASDGDTTDDLYVYDADPPAGQPSLAQASAGEVVAGSHPVAGTGAKVLGVLDNSADGSRAYLVAEGVLSGPNAQGKGPVQSAKNLYVFERDEANPGGRIAFLGALSGSDQNEWQVAVIGKSASALPTQGSEDGHILLFGTAAALLAEDTDAARDIYRYDDDAGSGGELLQCVSCAGGGPFDAVVALRTTNNFSRPDYAQQARVADADASTVVFATKEALLPGEDANGTWDVYGWEQGSLDLISGGTEGFGTSGSTTGPAVVSPDGEDIFFVTRAPLDPADANNALDLYDARVGGGFPAQPVQLGCEGEAGCHGAPPPAPAAAAAGSAAFAGAGNVAAAPACRKGFVRRHGKCVKKKHGAAKKRKKSKQRAGSKRGAGR